MKKILLSLITFCFVVTAHSENYLGIGYGPSWNGGHAWLNDKKYDYETFSGMGVAFLGTIFPTNWIDFRGEVELTRLNLKPDIGRTRRFRSIMGNVTAIIPETGWWAEPYVGAGIGYARWDHNNTISTQILLGLEKEFTLPENLGGYNMAADLEFRHLWVGEDGGKRRDISRMNSDALLLKLKYFF